MIKAIFYGIFVTLAILTTVIYHVPGFWIFLAVVIFWLAKTFNPFRPSVETLPRGFTEKKFNTGEVNLNYVEGSKNGPPLLFIPGQMEFWQGYKLVMPHFSKNIMCLSLIFGGTENLQKHPANIPTTSVVRI